MAVGPDTRKIYESFALNERNDDFVRIAAIRNLDPEQSRPILQMIAFGNARTAVRLAARDRLEGRTVHPTM